MVKKSLRKCHDRSGILMKSTFRSPLLSMTRLARRLRFPWKCGSRRWRRLCMLWWRWSTTGNANSDRATDEPLSLSLFAFPVRSAGGGAGGCAGCWPNLAFLLSAYSMSDEDLDELGVQSALLFLKYCQIIGHKFIGTQISGHRKYN